MKNQLYQNQNSAFPVLKTICYADIFDYPLTCEQIWKYCISNEKISKTDVLNMLDQESNVSKQNNYYFLSGRCEIINVRVKREVFSRRKMKKAKKIASFLSYIPTILLVGLSGSLAMRNSTEHDDIDFFIITRNDCLWITRFFISCFLFIIGAKRNRRARSVEDKICLNMYLSSDNLLFNNKNIYIAHEIGQLKPIINKENIYEQFLLANRWILRYLPNIFNEKRVERIVKARSIYDLSFPNRFLTSFVKGIDHIFFTIQKWYMKDHLTTEVVSKTIAKFHPQDKKNTIIAEYRKKLRAFRKYADESTIGYEKKEYWFDYSRILTY